VLPVSKERELASTGTVEADARGVKLLVREPEPRQNAIWTVQTWAPVGDGKTTCFSSRSFNYELEAWEVYFQERDLLPSKS
jgi:hypothetical protein